VIRRFALAVVLLLTLATACGHTTNGNSVTVLGSWTDAEQQAFETVIAGFEKSTGIKVNYTGTRDADSVLASEVANGDPPDLAVIGTPGELHQYAAAGNLRPIDAVLNETQMKAQYGQETLNLTAAKDPRGNPHTYAIIVKAALKSLIWYDPKTLPAKARTALTSTSLTWNGLTEIAAQLAATGIPPWCIGMEDTSNSGWPGTDWIEDILLHQSGPKFYDEWVAGRLPWTSPQVRSAWQTFAALVADKSNIRGGETGALQTNYGRAGTPMFTSPPGCYLDHEASFITGFYTVARTSDRTAPKPGTDFAFVPFPALTSAGQGAEEIAGDLLGMFNDTKAARKLITYLTTMTAQKTWVAIPAGGALSLNRAVPLSAYPDPLTRTLAKDLTTATAVRFDASDSMPAAMSTAFEHATLELLAAPTHLDQILTTLNTIQSNIPK
jgi:alpha-glucoside transport system substrate-binding protein